MFGPKRLDVFFISPRRIGNRPRSISKIGLFRLNLLNYQLRVSMAGVIGWLQDCCNPLLAVSQIVDCWWQECKEIGQNLWVLVKIHIKSSCLHQMIPYRYGQNISPNNVRPYQFVVHRNVFLHFYNFPFVLINFQSSLESGNPKSIAHPS